MKEKGAVLRAAGMMSGTSMDGVDLAIIDTDGIDLLGFGESRYRAYARDERETLRAALGKWPGEVGVAEAARVVEDAFLELAAGVEPVDVLGFHGQTLAHDPAGRGTHQAGDGARIADALDVTTVWDFRASDVALGGQGAPLAPFYHWAIARWAELREPVGFLNLGGVGNLTWVDPGTAAPERPGALFAFDTGPANAPLDDLMVARGLGTLDKGGALALRGKVEAGIVAEWLEAPFFAAPAPKSLDRTDFKGLASAVSPLSVEDALATLAACAAASVAAGLDLLPAKPSCIYASGGGTKNAALMRELRDRLACPVQPVEALGLEGDLIEAQAFAYLAVRVLKGLPTSCPGTTGVAAAVGGGEITRVRDGGAA